MNKHLLMLLLLRQMHITKRIVDNSITEFNDHLVDNDEVYLTDNHEDARDMNYWQEMMGALKKIESLVNQ